MDFINSLSLGRSYRIFENDLRLLSSIMKENQIKMKSGAWAISVLMFSAAQMGLKISNGFSRRQINVNALHGWLCIRIRATTAPLIKK